MDKLLSTTEAADLCGVHQTTVIRWIDAGHLSAQRTPGGHRRIEVRDLLTFMRAHHMPIPQDLRAASEAQSRIRVLVVDDEPRVLRTFVGALEKFPKLFEVEGTSSGVEALLKIGESPPDAVVLDLYMPGLDGFEVCKRLREERRFSHVDIVAVTGGDLDVATPLALEAGARVVLEKPVSPNQLQEAILAGRLLLTAP